MDSAIPNVEVNDQLIELLRSHLDSLISKHGTNSLLHPDIVHFSQLLDKFIAAYTMSSMKKNK